MGTLSTSSKLNYQVHPYIAISNTTVIQDDIIIASVNSKQHNRVLEHVIRAFEKAGLWLLENVYLDNQKFFSGNLWSTNVGFNLILLKSKWYQKWKELYPKMK